jgi:hypothetical protein
MLIDSLNEFSDAQAITSTAVSTNVIDLGAADNRALGRELYLHVLVNTPFDTSAATLTVTLQTGSTVTPTTVIATAPAIAASAMLVAGTSIWRIRVPANTQRYLRLNYTVSAGLTSGKVDAFLSPSLQDSFDVS